MVSTMFQNLIVRYHQRAWKEASVHSFQVSRTWNLNSAYGCSAIAGSKHDLEIDLCELILFLPTQQQPCPHRCCVYN